MRLTTAATNFGNGIGLRMTFSSFEVWVTSPALLAGLDAILNIAVRLPK